MALFPNTLPINTLTEQATFHAFAGPPLMPFWTITDLGMHHDWGQPSVSGFTMVNNPSQPPLQAPERTISIERTTRFGSNKYVACAAAPAGLLPLLPSPAFRSVAVVGPDGRDPREAFPPRGPTAGRLTPLPPERRIPPPPVRIPPGTIRR